MNADTLQKFSTPIAVVIAGALIAGAMIYNNQNAGGAQVAKGPSWEKQTIAKVDAQDHVLGATDAKVVLVEYSDTECPFCKVFHATAHQVVKEYEGKIAWVYRHYPIPQLHPKAAKEAEATECVASLSNEETFWKYLDSVYATTKSNNQLDNGVYNTPSPTPKGPDGKPYYTEKKPRSTTDAGQLTDLAVALGIDKVQFEKCMKEETFASRVSRDVQDGSQAGISGTPTSYLLVKGKQYPIEGAQPYDVVKKMIEEALKR